MKPVKPGRRATLDDSTALNAVVEGRHARYIQQAKAALNASSSEVVRAILDDFITRHPEPETAFRKASIEAAA